MTRGALCAVLVVVVTLAGCGGTPRDARPGGAPTGGESMPVAAATALDPAARPSRALLEWAAASVRERALAARFVIDELEVVDDPPGLRIGIRLREEQLFDEATHAWLSILFGRFDVPFAYDLTVSSPAGVAFFHMRVPEGGTEYGADAPSAPVPDEPAPASLDGATDLTVVFRGSNGGAATRRLVCQPTPRGVEHADRLCRRVLVDRWQLFFPQSTEVQCLGFIGEGVSVSGTLGGVPVETGYGSCSSARRWFDAFDVDPEALAPPPTTTG